MRRFCLGVREFRPISIAFFVFSLGQRPREWQLWAAELIESQFSCLICFASIAVGMRSSPGSPRSRYFSTAAPSLLPGSRTCRLPRLEGYSPRLAEYSLKSDDRWTSAVGDGYPRAPTFKRLSGILVGSGYIVGRFEQTVYNCALLWTDTARPIDLLLPLPMVYGKTSARFQRKEERRRQIAFNETRTNENSLLLPYPINSLSSTFRWEYDCDIQRRWNPPQTSPKRKTNDSYLV